MTKKKSVIYELFRFAVTGVACALLDYLVCQLIILAFSPTQVYDWIVTAISVTGGFLCGVTLNYILSTFWVYQNVDKNTNTKSTKFIILFVLLSAGALLLSVCTMLLCNVVCINAFNINIVDTEIMTLIKELGFGFLSNATFWAFFISFCIKTIVGLIFNYLTRKFILYKAPKENEPELKK